MRNSVKKLMAFLLTAVMALAMGTSVFAAELTIKNEGKTTYTAYQVMTATAHDDGNNSVVYTYEVTKEFAGFFDGNPYTLSNDNEILVIKDGENVIVSTDGRNTNTNSTDAAALAAELEKYALREGITGEVITSTADLEIGYYVLSENMTEDNSGKIVSKPILVNLTEDGATVTPKADEIGLDKKIVEGDKEVDANNVSIGDTVEYKITTQIPTYAANVDKNKLSFVLTDTLTNLEYVEGSAVLTVGETTLTKGTDYTLTVEGNVITVELTQDTIVDHQGETVVLTYSATLTKDAVVDSEEGNPNKVVLKYTNNPNSDDSEGYLDDEVVTYTYGFKLHKVDKNNPDKDMSGATFEIKDSAGKVLATFTLGTDGEFKSDNLVITIDENYVTIKGLDEGTYTITETAAPAGYAKLVDPIVVEIKDSGSEAGEGLNGIGQIKVISGQGTVENDDDGDGIVVDDIDGTIDLTVKIENIKGISLPETGMKTAMYCLVGGVILVLIGGLYFGFNQISNRKRQ